MMLFILSVVQTVLALAIGGSIAIECEKNMPNVGPAGRLLLMIPSAAVAIAAWFYLTSPILLWILKL
jgi:hypothetical protein